MNTARRTRQMGAAPRQAITEEENSALRDADGAAREAAAARGYGDDAEREHSMRGTIATAPRHQVMKNSKLNCSISTIVVSPNS